MAVDTPYPEYLEFAGKWAKARDAAAGEEAVKARRDEYLPMLKGQSKDDYAAYQAHTLLQCHGANRRWVVGHDFPSCADSHQTAGNGWFYRRCYI